MVKLSMTEPDEVSVMKRSDFFHLIKGTPRFGQNETNDISADDHTKTTSFQMTEFESQNVPNENSSIRNQLNESMTSMQICSFDLTKDKIEVEPLLDDLIFETKIARQQNSMSRMQPGFSFREHIEPVDSCEPE